MGSFIKANKFVVAEGEEGEIYIFIDAQKDLPEKPRVIYDGRDHAVFVRSPEEKIILDYIHPEVRDKLRKAPGVVMVETILEILRTAMWRKCRLSTIFRLTGRKSGWATAGKRLH